MHSNFAPSQVPAYKQHVAEGGPGLPARCHDDDELYGAAAATAGEPCTAADYHEAKALFHDIPRSINLKVCTSTDVVLNPLYGEEMVKTLDTLELWSVCLYPLLHDLHPQLCGTFNASLNVPAGERTHR